MLRLLACLALLVSTASAGVVTCVNDLDLIPANTYMVAGRITMSSSYATGGDTFSAGNSLGDVGACLCHSNARKPLVVIVEGEKGDFLFEFDRTNLKIKAKAPVFVFGSGAGNALLSPAPVGGTSDRKSTRLNSSHGYSSYAVFCLKKKKT